MCATLAMLRDRDRDAMSYYNRNDIAQSGNYFVTRINYTKAVDNIGLLIFGRALQYESSSNLDQYSKKKKKSWYEMTSRHHNAQQRETHPDRMILRVYFLGERIQRYYNVDENRGILLLFRVVFVKRYILQKKTSCTIKTINISRRARAFHNV